MSIRENKGKVAIAGILIGLFLYASIRQTHQLRLDMPREFANVTGAFPAEQRTNAEGLAKAYWECALTKIQWRYPFGSPLPHDPPPEFVVSAPDLGAIASDPAIRLQFWRKLEQLWYFPDTWNRRYSWSLDWITDSAKSIIEKVQRYMNKLPGAS